MYAFVVMVLISGTPQLFIMERGLTETQCEGMAAHPDTGLSIDGEPVTGQGSCIPESDLPSDSETDL